MKSCLLTISTLLLLHLSAVAVQAADREVVLGTVHKDSVFAVSKIVINPDFPQHGPGGPPVNLFRGALDVDPDKVYTAQHYKFARQYVLEDMPYRWRIVRDMFWGSGTTGVQRMGSELKRLPLEDLKLYGLANGKRKEQYMAKFPKDQLFGTEHYYAHSWTLDPMADVAFQRRPFPRNEKLSFVPPASPGVFFDAYPVSNDRVVLFVLDQDKMKVWSGTAKVAEDCSWNMDWGDVEKELETFPSPFKEAFTVFVRDKDYYFVTESGSVYLSRDPGKGERKIEQIWDGKRLPVHALITDAATDKVYCFVEPAGKDPKDEDRVYFELAAKPETKPYKLNKIEKPKIAEPLKSVLEYAHVLRDDKRIK